MGGAGEGLGWERSKGVVWGCGLRGWSKNCLSEGEEREWKGKGKEERMRVFFLLLR